MDAHLWPIRFEFMTSFCIFQGLTEFSNSGVGSRAIAEEEVVVTVEGDGLRVAFYGLKEISLFTQWIHGCG